MRLQKERGDRLRGVAGLGERGGKGATNPSSQRGTVSAEIYEY